MASTSPLLRQILAQSATAGGLLLGRCLEQATASLQEAENKSGKVAERQEIAAAWRELLKQRPGWVARYPQELQAAFVAAPAAAPASPAPPPRGGGHHKLDALTLVDDSALLQTIESSRLSQLIVPMVEQPLAELDALMSSVLGLSAVRPEQNPLRPDTFAQALRKLMGEVPGEAQHASWWLRHLATPLGRELERLYRDTVDLLKKANVQAATYRVLPAAPGAPAPRPTPPAAQGGKGSGGGGGGGGRGGSGIPAGMPALAQADLGTGSAWADLSAVQIGDELVQDFLWRSAPQQHAPLGPAYYSRVREELAALEAHSGALDPVYEPTAAESARHLPVVDRPQRAVAVDSPLPGQRWGAFAAPRERSLVRSRLKEKAEHVGQVLGLEVVRKLVNQVAQDPRLLAPVRESIVALEPSLLRLAMVDPRFFGKEEHPARRLVERVAERSFKYNDEFADDFQAFANSVAAEFNALNAQELSDVAPVEQALERLEGQWAAQDAQEAQRREEVLERVRFAEERQGEADQIAWELSQRADLDNVPAVVQDFLFGPWALVMAHARLADGRRQIDPGGYGSVVTDLLWSVKRDQTLRKPARAIELIPRLLERLRDGLAQLGQDAREADSFFTALEKLHRPVLKLRAKHRKEVLNSSAVPLEVVDDPALQPVPRQQPRPAQELWMGQDELDAAGFRDTLPTDYSELEAAREALEGEVGGADGHDAAAAGEAATPAAAPVDPAEIIASLREGCWVDLSSRRQWLRAKLIWASSKGTLFMFTSQGGQPHSMTRRSLERLVRERLLRPVDMQGVVEHAIEQLTHDGQQRKPRERNSQPAALAA